MISLILAERIIMMLCIASLNQIAHEGSPQYAHHYWSALAPKALPVCLEIAKRAQDQNLNPAEVIALSAIETRHTAGLTSKAGAKGPLQALPKYWSRKDDRDYIDAGLRAWRYYKKRFKTPRAAAGYYNGGGKNSAYARAYQHHLSHLQKIKSVALWPR